MVCALFCVVAMVAGLVVARLSSAGTPIAADLAPGAVEPTPLATPGVPVSNATSGPLEVAELPTALLANAEAAETPISLADDIVSDPTSTAKPALAPTLVPTLVPTPTLAGNFAEYTVQPGDALLDIAKKYQLTIKDIMAVNEIADPDSLRVGQVLRIPLK